MVSTTLDPDGRRVFLTDESWEHIQAGHATLAPKLREVMTAVREPVRRMPGRDEREVWFFGPDAGRFPWIQVVVHYEGGSGWIRTAFPTEKLPA